MSEPTTDAPDEVTPAVTAEPEASTDVPTPDEFWSDPEPQDEPAQDAAPEPEDAPEEAPVASDEVVWAQPIPQTPAELDGSAEAAIRRAAMEPPPAPAVVDDRAVPFVHQEGYAANGNVYCARCHQAWPCPDSKATP